MHYHLEIHDGVAELSIGEYYSDYLDDYYLYPYGNSIRVTVDYDGGNYIDFGGEIDNTYAIWGITNIIGRVALTNDIPKSADLTPATNYTDAVATDFENGTRTVQYANNSGHSTYSTLLYDESAMNEYNASWLIRESTNAATWAASGRVSTNSLSGQTYDFSDMRGVYLSLSNIIIQMGGTVTNFPSFQQ